MLSRAALALTIAVAPLGCAQILEIAELSETAEDAVGDHDADAGAGGSASPDGGNGTDPCCVPGDIAAGWDGPAVLYVGTIEPPGCDGPWQQGPRGGININADNTPCECDCGAVTASCGTSSSLSWYADTSCNGGATTVTPNTTACTTLQAGAAVTGAVGDTVAALAANCQASVLNAPTPADWLPHASLCIGTLEPDDSCGTDWCEADPPMLFDDGLCIYKLGDAPCPDGAYRQRRLIHQTIDDDRSCGACTCTPPQDVVCTTSSSLYTASDCTGATAMVNHDQTCQGVSLPDDVLSYQLTVAGVTAAPCVPAGGAIVGDAVMADPVTVCCSP